MIRASLLLVCLAACGAAHASSPVDAAIAHIAQRSSDTRSDAVLVLRNGEVLLDRHTGTAPAPIELMSVTKSVVALIVGRAVTQGHITSVDQPVSDWYPEWKQGRKRAITLRMLMNHTSGLQDLQTTSEEIYPAPDFVQLALAAELRSDPGKDFAYSNKATNLIAGIVERATGEPMDTYAGRELFAPLGITRWTWTRDKAGNPHAMSGLQLAARDAATLGRLVLDRGTWGNETLIDATYIDAMLAASARTPEVGMLWWRKPEWTRFSADDRTFAMLEKAGIDAALVAALRPLGGQHFDDFTALDAAAEKAIGPNWRERWHRDVVATTGIGPWRAFNADTGPIGAYQASGYLGQSIVVIPSTRLVGVRQITSRDTHAPSDDFPDFADALLALSAAIRAEGAPSP